jgi:hypothetical protein
VLTRHIFDMTTTTMIMKQKTHPLSSPSIWAPQKKLIHWSHMHGVSQIISSTHPLIGFKHMVVHIHNLVD